MVPSGIAHGQKIKVIKSKLLFIGNKRFISIFLRYHKQAPNGKKYFDWNSPFRFLSIYREACKNAFNACLYLIKINYEVCLSGKLVNNSKMIPSSKIKILRKVVIKTTKVVRKLQKVVPKKKL